MRHFVRDPVLGAEHLDEGDLVLCLALADAGQVAEAEVLQFPDDLQIPVAAGAEIALVAVDPTAEDAAANVLKLAVVSGAVRPDQHVGQPQ